MRAHEGVRLLGCLVGNFPRFPRGFSEQLRLARAIHGNEPPCSFVNGVPDGKQAMIAENGGFLPANSAGDAIAFGGLLDNSSVIVEDDVIFVERTGVLCERIESAAKRGPRFAV